MPGSDIENKPFQAPQTETYLFACSDLEACFLVFVMRTVCKSAIGNSADSPDSANSADSPDSPNSSDSANSADSPNSPDPADSADSSDSSDSSDSVNSADSNANLEYPQLLLTPEQTSAAKALNVALDKPDIQAIQLLGPIHTLAFALISTCRSEAAENQFLSPHILYLIYSNIRSDHVFETPEIISKCLAEFIWVTRSTAIYEALEHAKNSSNSMLK